MVEFLQLIKQGEFALEWDSCGIQPSCCKNLNIKHGINEIGFQLPSNGIKLNFEIKTRRGFDYLCAFAESYGYKKPDSCTINVQGRVIDPKGLQEAETKNAEIKARVQQLIEELEHLTTIDIRKHEYDIDTLVDTTRFYEWLPELQFAPQYQIVEEDQVRMNAIWYVTRILHDC